MPVLHILVDVRYPTLEVDALKGVDRDKIVELQTPVTIGAIADGMQSGKPSVFFVFELPHGERVFAETSYELFRSAATALEARYGSDG